MTDTKGSGAARSVPVPGLSVRATTPILGVLITVGVFLAWWFVPLKDSVALEIYVWLVGAAATGAIFNLFSHAVARDRSTFEAAAAPVPPRPDPIPKERVQLGQAVQAGTHSGREAFVKLRPILRDIATSRLSAIGVDLDKDLSARKLLGPAYDYVQENRSLAEPLYEDPLDLETIAKIISALEEI